MNSEHLDSQSGNILIIDDTPANLKILMGLLSENGYKVRPMPSGKLALQGIHLDYPDLILLDIDMPEMDGYQVCQHLQEDGRTRGIPVIFVSSYEDVFDKVKAFKVGGVDYITKPFQPEEVLVRVQNHLVLYQLKKGLQEKTKHQDRKLAEQNALLQQMNQELSGRLQQLQEAQLQLVQAEKMSTLGQLVAGIAHEINNPVTFLKGNIQPAQTYVEDLLGLLALYQEACENPGDKIKSAIDAIELDFLRTDLPQLINSMNVGIERIENISTSLRIFSRTDRENKVLFNLNDGIESTLLILKHRLQANERRPEIEVVKDYGYLPEIHCFPGQLNQVFMNIFSNGIDALDEGNFGCGFDEICDDRNLIFIQTFQEIDGQIVVKISDNGIGMSDEVKNRIFEQGFTTKGVGKGTGLGMAIARQIVEEKHGGTITCHSEFGKGTEFIIKLPICL